MPLFISLPSREALLNQIFYVPTPLTQKPFIFQDTLTCPSFLTKPPPLSCNCPHHHHHFSYSLPDLPQLDPAALEFSTQEPRSCVPPETSTGIRDHSPENVPLRSRLLWKVQNSGQKSRRDLKVWGGKWVYLKIKQFPSKALEVSQCPFNQIIKPAPPTHALTWFLYHQSNLSCSWNKETL